MRRLVTVTLLLALVVPALPAVAGPETGEGPREGTVAAGAAESRPVGAIPTQADTDACNRHASAQVGPRDGGAEVLKDALLGGALTAGVGAAIGAIAGRGKGAGKGAAIGGLVGAVGGTLYGLNENRRNDEHYRIAYANCMRARGYAG